MSTLSVMDRTGHTSVEFDVKTGHNLDEARALYQELLDKGYRAFESFGADRPAEPLEAFKADAKEIVMIPNLVGG